MPLNPPPETTGSISVDITGGKQVEGRVTGSITTRLKDVGSTLNIDSDEIKSVIRRLKPSAGYTGFWYASMTKTLTPTSNKAEVVSVDRVPMIATFRTYDNDSSSHATYSSKLTHTETNTVGVEWSTSQQTETNFSLGCNVALSGSTGLRFNNTCGKSQQQSTSVQLSSEDSVSVTLAPGQKKKASLKVSKMVVTLKINFRVTYGGHIVGNRKDYANDTYDFGEILEKLNRRRYDTVSQTVRLTYFTDSQVVLTDL